MAKKKENTEDIVRDESLDNPVGSDPGQNSGSSPRTVETEDDAMALVKSLYTVPDGCDTVYVTSDKNVFWKENHDSAVNHAVKNNLKLFTLAWQAYQK